MSNVTQVLSLIEQGDATAPEKLLPLVYEELRKLAAIRLAQEKPGQTLQATALVHEAYVRLIGGQSVQSWDSRGHFFAAAAEAMRRILVENARRKQREKHGGHLQQVDFLNISVAETPRDEELLQLDEALTRLATVRPQAAEIVQLRFFAGISAEQVAQMVGISERTARPL